MGNSKLFALPLEGWERRSIWGFDAGTGSWFAQLWRNDLPDDPVSDAPHIGIGPLYGHHITSVTELLSRIATATGAELSHLDQLMVDSMRS